MTTDRSAYETLGLRPGAGRVEVNEAYRRLMKEHHPDRPGGDADRAAEINSAYSALRARLGEPIRMPVPIPVRRRPPRFRRPAALFIILILGGIIALQRSDVGRALSGSSRFLSAPMPVPANGDDRLVLAEAASPFDESVEPEIIDRAVADALKFHSNHDWAAASEYSSDCHKALERERNVGWFDTCAAFDEAMLAFDDDAQAGGSGPFDESSVIIRELSSARLLSDDSLAADARLHQIRSRVDFEVLPMLDSAAGVRP